MRVALAGVLACGLIAPAMAQKPQVDWATARHLTVTMVDYRFEPDHLVLDHGVPYVLHMVNRGGDVHEFTAPDFFAASLVRDPHLISRGGDQVVLQPGATADVALVPLHAGRFDLRCADHDWDGMVGEIDVK
ncbi:MAG TPA: cupredoxin domain-containing protein [Acetobacteraceae bacterium]